MAPLFFWSLVMYITAIFGMIDKSLGLIQELVSRMPNFEQKELNKLYEIKGELETQKNLPVEEQLFDRIANLQDVYQDELDRVREVIRAA